MPLDGALLEAIHFDSVQELAALLAQVDAGGDDPLARAARWRDLRIGEQRSRRAAATATA